MELPYTPLDSYEFHKRKVEKNSYGWDIISYCYKILQKKTGLTIEQLKGEKPVLGEDGKEINSRQKMLNDTRKRLQDLKLELDEEDNL